MEPEFTRDELIAIRGIFQFMADDWDDPAMDVYDDVYSEKKLNESHYTDVSQLMQYRQERES